VEQSVPLVWDGTGFRSVRHLLPGQSSCKNRDQMSKTEGEWHNSFLHAFDQQPLPF